jgi:hypothetical protein
MMNVYLQFRPLDKVETLKRSRRVFEVVDEGNEPDGPDENDGPNHDEDPSTTTTTGVTILEEGELRGMVTGAWEYPEDHPSSSSSAKRKKKVGLSYERIDAFRSIPQKLVVDGIDCTILHYGGRYMHHTTTTDPYHYGLLRDDLFHSLIRDLMDVLSLHADSLSEITIRCSCYEAIGGGSEQPMKNDTTTTTTSQQWFRDLLWCPKRQQQHSNEQMDDVNDDDNNNEQTKSNENGDGVCRILHWNNDDNDDDEDDVWGCTKCSCITVSDIQTLFTRGLAARSNTYISSAWFFQIELDIIVQRMGSSPKQRPPQRQRSRLLIVDWMPPIATAASPSTTTTTNNNPESKIMVGIPHSLQVFREQYLRKKQQPQQHPPTSSSSLGHHHTTALGGVPPVTRLIGNRIFGKNAYGFTYWILTASPTDLARNETSCIITLSQQLMAAAKSGNLVQPKPSPQRRIVSLLHDNPSRTDPRITRQLAKQCLRMRQSMPQDHSDPETVDNQQQQLWKYIEYLAAAPPPNNHRQSSTTVDDYDEDETLFTKSPLDMPNDNHHHATSPQSTTASTLENLERVACERDQAMATVQVCQAQNQTLTREMEILRQKLSQVEASNHSFQSTNLALSQSLQISQFRESEAIVLLRQLRKFYMRILERTASSSSSESSASAWIPGAPDSTQLVDLDHVLVQAGLLEPAEVGKDAVRGNPPPSAAALEQCRQNIIQIQQQQQQSAFPNSSSSIPITTARESEQEHPENIEARQRIYRTPAGQYMEMRERILSEELVMLSEQNRRLTEQLNEERANVEALTISHNNPGGVLFDKMRAAQELRRCKAEVERKECDLKAVIWKMNELSMVSKTLGNQNAELIRHARSLEHRMTELLEKTHLERIEHETRRVQLCEEIRALQTKIQKFTSPTWHFAADKDHIHIPMRCRLIVPFVPSAGTTAEQDFHEELPMPPPLLLSDDDEKNMSNADWVSWSGVPIQRDVSTQTEDPLSVAVLTVGTQTELATYHDEQSSRGGTDSNVKSVEVSSRADTADALLKDLPLEQIEIDYSTVFRENHNSEVVDSIPPSFSAESVLFMDSDPNLDLLEVVPSECCVENANTQPLYSFSLNPETEAVHENLAEMAFGQFNNIHDVGKSLAQSFEGSVDADPTLSYSLPTPCIEAPPHSEPHANNIHATLPLSTKPDSVQDNVSPSVASSSCLGRPLSENLLETLPLPPDSAHDPAVFAINLSCDSANTKLVDHEQKFTFESTEIANSFQNNLVANSGSTSLSNSQCAAASHDSQSSKSDSMLQAATRCDVNTQSTGDLPSLATEATSPGEIMQISLPEDTADVFSRTTVATAIDLRDFDNTGLYDTTNEIPMNKSHLQLDSSQDSIGGLPVVDSTTMTHDRSCTSDVVVNNSSTFEKSIVITTLAASNSASWPSVGGNQVGNSGMDPIQVNTTNGAQSYDNCSSALNTLPHSSTAAEFEVRNTNACSIITNHESQGNNMSLATAATLEIQRNHAAVVHDGNLCEQQNQFHPSVTFPIIQSEELQCNNMSLPSAATLGIQGNDTAADRNETICDHENQFNPARAPTLLPTIADAALEALSDANSAEQLYRNLSSTTSESNVQSSLQSSIAPNAKENALRSSDTEHTEQKKSGPSLSSFMTRLQNQAKKKNIEEDEKTETPEFLKMFKKIGGKNKNEEVIESTGAAPIREAHRPSFEKMRHNATFMPGYERKFEKTKHWTPRRRRKKDEDSDSEGDFARKFRQGVVHADPRRAPRTSRKITAPESSESDDDSFAANFMRGAQRGRGIVAAKQHDHNNDSDSDGSFPARTKPKFTDYSDSESDLDTDNSAGRRKISTCLGNDSLDAGIDRGKKPLAERTKENDSVSESDSESDSGDMSEPLLTAPAPKKDDSESESSDSEKIGNQRMPAINAPVKPRTKDDSDIESDSDSDSSTGKRKVAMNLGKKDKPGAGLNEGTKPLVESSKKKNDDSDSDSDSGDESKKPSKAPGSKKDDSESESSDSERISNQRMPVINAPVKPRTKDDSDIESDSGTDSSTGRRKAMTNLGKNEILDAGLDRQKKPLVQETKKYDSDSDSELDDESESPVKAPVSKKDDSESESSDFEQIKTQRKPSKSAPAKPRAKDDSDSESDSGTDSSAGRRKAPTNLGKKNMIDPALDELKKPLAKTTQKDDSDSDSDFDSGDESISLVKTAQKVMTDSYLDQTDVTIDSKSTSRYHVECNKANDPEIIDLTSYEDTNLSAKKTMLEGGKSADTQPKRSVPDITPKIGTQAVSPERSHKDRKHLSVKNGKLVKGHGHSSSSMGSAKKRLPKFAVKEGKLVKNTASASTISSGGSEKKGKAKVPKTAKVTEKSSSATKDTKSMKEKGESSKEKKTSTKSKPSSKIADGKHVKKTTEGDGAPAAIKTKKVVKSKGEKESATSSTKKKKKASPRT